MCKYSIIIPTHNRPKLLVRAINSIKNQSVCGNFEIIVVSDMVDIKTDILCSRLLEKNDIYIRRRGKPGPAESRNLALKVCTGDAVIFLDDDDELAPNCIENIEKYRQDNSPFFYFNAEIVVESRFQDEVIEHERNILNLENNLNKFMYVKNQIPICNIVFPIHIVRNIFFESCMKAYEDWDYLLSVFDKSKPKFTPFIGSIIHQVNDNTSDRRGSSMEAISNHAILDYLFVYKKHSVTDEEIKIARNNLISICGINIGAEYL